MRKTTIAGRRHGSFAKGTLGLALAASVLALTPSPALSAPTAGDLILSGAVVSGLASFETKSGHRDSDAAVMNEKALGGSIAELMWWPSDQADESTQRIAAAAESAKPMTVVGLAKSDSNGRYTISGKPTAEMIAAAAKNDGWINFMLATSNGADYTLEGVSRHWDAKAKKWSDFGQERPGMSPKETRKTVFAKDVKTGEAKYGNSPKLAAKAAARSAGTMAVSSFLYCSFAVESYSYKHTAVLEAHAASTANGQFEYGATADSDIDIGVNYSGASWTIGGTYHVGNSLQTAIIYRTYGAFGQYIGTNFRYEHGTIRDTSGYGECDYTNDKFIRANRWEGGGMSFMHDVLQYDCTDQPQYNYRDWYPQNGGWVKKSSRSAKFGVAVTVAGINLGATSGYSDRVDMDWVAVRGPMTLCGNNAYPAYAQIIYNSPF